MSTNQPETPASIDDLYYARGEDVDNNRPVFTGDVFAAADPSEQNEPAAAFIIVQHPCALRVGGVELVDPVLVAQISQVQGTRSNWAKESIRQMPLPDLFLDGQHYAAKFTDLALVTRADIGGRERVAILSQHGVNLLLQRWVHHNSRVVVPTMTYNEQTTGEFEEADLAAEWCAERGHDGVEEFHDWIRTTDTGASATRQKLLRNPQSRATVRRAMNAELRRLRAQP
ncbi:hypothetical protein [Pseudarthrobacter sp. H2]|uniref:hypothetical protein n=1 Tax=Pseudarthrobacter sp. H2 TaxID=3418415 RepID=UPI003CED5E72